MELSQYYVAAWIGGGLGVEWIHAYVWLSRPAPSTTLKSLLNHIPVTRTTFHQKTVIILKQSSVLLFVPFPFRSCLNRLPP